MLQFSSGDNQHVRRWPLSFPHIYGCCHLAKLLLETFFTYNQYQFMAQQGTVSKGAAILYLWFPEKLLWKLNPAKNYYVLNDLLLTLYVHMQDLIPSEMSVFSSS